MTPFRLANFIEAGLWITLGGGFLLAAIFKPAARSACVGTAVALIAFGISDIVETSTGAWWRPWWLLMWKATCIIALILQLIQ